MRQVSQRTRCGVTLVELMVVVGMILVLLAIALPTLKFALSGRQKGEASRRVNTFLYTVQAKAAQTQLPVGVLIERHSGSMETPDVEAANQSFRLYTASVPPPYSGDLVGAKASVLDSRITGHAQAVSFSGITSAQLPNLGKSDGNRIRFDYRGSYFELRLPLDPGPDGFWGTPGNDDGDGSTNEYDESGWPGSDDVTLWPPAVGADPIVMGLEHVEGSNAPFPPDSVSFPYQIIRKPIKSSEGSIELPKGTVVDLNASGFKAGGLQFAASSPIVSPVIIMFQPSGAIDRLYFDDNAGVNASGTVFLMIGSDDELELNNLNNEDNFWISIGHSTGAITSERNIANSNVVQARRLARESQTMGGS